MISSKNERRNGENTPPLVEAEKPHMEAECPKPSETAQNRRLITLPPRKVVAQIQVVTPPTPIAQATRQDIDAPEIALQRQLEESRLALEAQRQNYISSLRFCENALRRHRSPFWRLLRKLSKLIH